jgi:hypothetical protein
VDELLLDVVAGVPPVPPMPPPELELLLELEVTPELETHIAVGVPFAFRTSQDWPAGHGVERQSPVWQKPSEPHVVFWGQSEGRTQPPHPPLRHTWLPPTPLLSPSEKMGQPAAIEIQSRPKKLRRETFFIPSPESTRRRPWIPARRSDGNPT